MSNANREWEILGDCNYNNQSFRLWVPGGWLVKSIIKANSGAGGVSITQNFVVDPNHVWKI